MHMVAARLGCQSAMVETRVWLLRLEVDLGSVLEPELGQKWRYGALKACIG